MAAVWVAVCTADMASVVKCCTFHSAQHLMAICGKAPFGNWAMNVWCALCVHEF